MTAEQRQTLGEQIARYWGVIICFATVLISVGYYQSRINTLETVIATLQNRQDKSEDSFQDLKNGVVELKTILNERLPAKKYGQ